MDAAATSTLADVVSASTGAARVLEFFELDYCCGGLRTLGDACASAGVDVAVVLEALEGLGRSDAAEEVPAWASMGLVELVDHIEATHHAYLHTELARLDALADRVALVHGERHHELLRVEATYAALRADLEPHLFKEEQVLFPMIRELAASTGLPAFHCGSLRNPIGMMLVEHDRAGELLADLREVTRGYAVPADGCASYRELYQGLAELEADTHLHVHKENNLLFPAVVALEAERAAAAGPA